MRLLPRDAEDVLAVGRPLRRVERLLSLARELDGVPLVERHDPQVGGAAAVGDEDDAFAVGTEPRLRIERHAARERRRFAAGDRNGVEVAEMVEDDRLAVGTDVERQPASDVRGELDRALGLERQALLHRIRAAGVATRAGAVVLRERG